MLDNTCFKIWEKLQDDLSRKIFLERLKYSFCGGFQGNHCVEWLDLFRRSAPQVLSDWDKFIDEARAGALEGKSLWIFGAAEGAQIALSDMKNQDVLKKVNFHGFVDNYQTGTFHEKAIISFDELLSISTTQDCVAIIATIRERTQRQILVQIESHNFNGNVYRLFGEGIYTIQYSDITLSENEIFVDVGCCDGNTTLEFIKRVGGKYRYIYAFEAEHKNYMTCLQSLKGVKDCEIVEIALSDFNGSCTLSVSDSPGGHTIDRIENSIHNIGDYSAQSTVKCVLLDDFLRGKEVSYIKMDIEGAEAAALRGAEQTIRKHKPKLAVSVYHKPEDILEIPAMILNYNPEYKFRLRHYELSAGDTVLYAE